MTKHLIHRATIDCAVPDTEVGVIRDWCTSELLEILDTALKPWQDTERRWVIPNLTLQVDLSMDAFYHMPLSARAYIREKIENALNVAVQSEEVRQVDSVAYMIEQISGYINSGYFTARPDDSVYEEWMQQWKFYWNSMEEANIPVVLKQFARDKNALRRWFGSLPRKTVIRILSKLWDTDEQQFGELWLLTEKMHEGHQDFSQTSWWTSQLQIGLLSGRRRSKLIPAFAELLLKQFTTKASAMTWVQRYATPDIISTLDMHLELTRETVESNEVDELLENLTMKSNEGLHHVDVSCAGLVLLVAFLPRWIEETGQGDKDTLYLPAQTPIRLHYLATGKSECTENDLLFMKILCGLEAADACDTDFNVSPEFERKVNEFLRAVLGHWERMHGTSIEGLREYFLMRIGQLSLQGDTADLRIAPAAFDVLLSFVPWNFRTFKLPWMKYVMTVDWN